MTEAILELGEPFPDQGYDDDSDTSTYPVHI